MNDDLAGRFWRDGYVIARGIFSKSEIAKARTDVVRNFEADERTGAVWEHFGARGSKGDLLSKVGLRDLLLDGRLLSLVERLLGAQPSYFGDSSFQFGEGPRGWHRDNRVPDRHTFTADDWKGRYPIIRVGIYLQDHKWNSGGLGVRVGSHEASRLGRVLSRDLPFMSPALRLKLLERAAYRHGRPILVGSEPGDVVVWSLRTVHTGNSVRLRFAPNLKLPPDIERRIPRSLTVPAADERMACFASFGLPGQHLTNLLEFMRKRADVVDHWRSSRFPEAVWQQARDRGLHMIRPINEYGVPLAEAS